MAIIKITVSAQASISATATEAHIPSTLKISGKSRTAAIWNTSVRKNDMSAEISPLFSAVNIDEPNMDIPANRKETEKS